MAELKRQVITIPLPAGAAVKGTQVTWTVKGKKKVGELTANGRVRIQSDKWTVVYTDETGKRKTVSTGTDSKTEAIRIMASLETEVIRIRSGVVTRDEIDGAKASSIPASDVIAKYVTALQSEDRTAKHIKQTDRQASEVLSSMGCRYLCDVTTDKIREWVAGQLAAGARTRKTINEYVSSLRGLFSWAIDAKLAGSNPAAKIKKLNNEIGQKKRRRSLTEDEVERLLEATLKRKYRQKNKAEEHVLIYRLLLGTGLRSGELGAAMPHQFDFERGTFAVIAEATKNKRSDVLPIRRDLLDDLKAWIKKQGTKPGERIFGYNPDSLRRSFYCDLKAAGIPAVGEDGRSVDVHSLRRTFGTMLARAGVPLTTTQKLMRHSTPVLTAKIYIDVDPIDMLQAVDRLPGFKSTE